MPTVVPGISTLTDDLFQAFDGSPALLCFHALEKSTQDGVVTHPLILPSVSLFRPKLAFFLQEFL
ncbi:MAG TPA: hypothetical protein VKJ01_15950, partial [Candidatus Solibacter sp.]|nr:hypothetical protein [Candidatus Solibacter sp.]